MLKAVFDICPYGRTYSSAIRLDENLTEAYVGRGDAYVALAEKIIAEAEGESENTVQSDKVKELYELAKADYLSALEQDDQQVELYKSVAEIYFAQEDFNSAVDILDKGIELTGNEELYQFKVQKMHNRSRTVTITGEIFDNKVEYAEKNSAYIDQYGFTVREDGNRWANVGIVACGVRFSSPVIVEINGENVSINEAGALGSSQLSLPSFGTHVLTGYFTYDEDYSEVKEDGLTEAPYTYWPNGPYTFDVTSVS